MNQKTEFFFTISREKYKENVHIPVTHYYTSTAYPTLTWESLYKLEPSHIIFVDIGIEKDTINVYFESEDDMLKFQMKYL